MGSKLVTIDYTGSTPHQGYAVAINADGTTIAIGGHGDNNFKGAVWIYTRSGSTWVQQGSKLVGTSMIGDSFYGSAVSLSADGNTAMVGGYNDNNKQGAIWMHSRNGSTWTQQGSKLVGTGNTAAILGVSVCLSSDGTTAMSGGCLDNSSQGATWVYNFVPSTNANLSGLAISSGTLSPAFAAVTTTYSASVAYNTASITVTPTKADINASIQVRVNGGSYVSVTSGSASGALALNGGSNTIDIKVTAQDGATIKTYNITVQRPTPSITSFTPSSGPIGSLITITGVNLGTPTALTIGGANAILISNTGSSLVAMVMPGATSGTIMITTSSGSSSSSSNFSVTSTLIPNKQQGGLLTGTGNSGLATQGESVALSADGNTAIVGGSNDNNGNGAAWIYKRSGGTWSQQGSKLVGTGNTGNARQGYSVALSADGNTAILGGIADNSGTGAIWVFTRSGNEWIQQGTKLVGSGSAGTSRQGSAVSLSADGNTVIVGGYTDDFNTGAVWIFVRLGIQWAQQGNKLIGTDNTGNSLQGISVSLSADGNTAIVGGYGDNSNQGAVWVYIRNAGIWTQQGGKLLGTGSCGQARQGSSVSLSADGNTALVGGVADNSQGAAWVFTRTSGLWSQQGSKFTGTGNAGNAQQGRSVALSADGNTAILGGYSDDMNQGAIWIFIRNGNVWNQYGSKLVGTGNTGNARQGYSVALSANGTTVISGGHHDNEGEGAAWIYTFSSLHYADLSGLILSSGLIAPDFNAAQTSYSASVSNATISVIVTPYPPPTATVAVRINTGPFGNESMPLQLNVGSNIIYVKVTAEDGTTTKIYTITVTRAAACTAPESPSLSATNDNFCNGGSTTLSVTSGNLNSASAWKWYTGSCGGTLVDSGTSITVSPTSTTTYYARGEGGCVTPGTCASITLTVYPTITPSVTLTATPSGTITSGTSVSFTANAITPNTNLSSYYYTWRLNGNTVQSSNSSTYSSTTLAHNDSVTVIVSMTANAGYCLNTGSGIKDTIVMAVSTPGTWYSKSTGNLNSIATWGEYPDGSGSQPSTFGTGTFKLSNRTSYPLTNGDWSNGGTVDIPAGNTLHINNGTVFTASKITGTGSISGTSNNSRLTITGSDSSTLYFTPGANSLFSLLVSNGKVKLGNALNVYGGLTLDGGAIMYTSNLLTLKSSSIQTAVVHPVSGTISGNVTVERYIPSSGRKSYVMLSAPVNSPTIYNAWQEGGAATLGYGMQITGPAGTSAANGFDATSFSGFAAIFTYNDNITIPTDKWVGLTNTNINTLAPGKGYMVYVRGDRTIRPSSSAVSNTILRATGTLATGVVTPALVTPQPNKYNLIANPYACPVDWTSAGITKTNIRDAFWVYDPATALFITYNNGIISPANTRVSKYLQSGQAFFIQNAATGTPSITFNESAKAPAASTAVNTTVLGEVAMPARLDINVYRSDSSLADGVVALLGKEYSKAIDKEDAGKMDNLTETFSLLRNNTKLSIEGRPLTGNDTLFFTMENFSKKAYKMEINGEQFTGHTSAILADNYTGTKTPLNLNGTNVYPFTVNGDEASATGNRFMITFGSSTATIADVAAGSGFSVKLSPNPVKDRLTLAFEKPVAKNTTITIINSLGQVVKTIKAGKQAAGTLNISMAALPAGMYSVQLLANEKPTAVYKIVKE